jgi:hypothetical protein
MFNPKQFRDKAAEFFERGKTASSLDETHAYGRLERSFTALADNEQWLSDNHQKTIKAAGADGPGGDTLAEQEQYLLCCLGAAVIMQWNTLPQKLQRELFDTAGSMGELMETAELRGRIARFLHKHKDENAGGSEGGSQRAATGSPLRGATAG